MSYTYTAFPCNIPVRKPGYATLALQNVWDDMQERVSKRMKKLREVVKLLGEDEDKCAVAIAKAFSDNGHLLSDKYGELLLDDLTAQEIADTTRPLMKYLQWEPFARFPNAVAVVNTMFITTREWEIIRCMGFGGSDSAVMMGIHKYESSSERTLAHTKTDIPATSEDDYDRQFIFDYGHIREPLVIKTFCQKTGARQIPCPFLYRHKNYEWMTANIDAVVEMPDGTLAVFEAKTSGGQNWETWRVSIPQQYTFQPIQYMAVLDDPRVNRAYIAVILANTRDSWFCHTIERDLAVEASLIQHEEEFFNSYVLTGDKPDFSGNIDQDLFAFFTYEKVLDPNATVSEVELTGSNIEDRLGEWHKLEERRKTLSAQLDSVKELQTQIALEIMAEDMQGTETKAYFLPENDPDMMYEVSCRKTTRTNVDKDTLRLKYPDVYKDPLVVSEKRSFADPSISYKKRPKSKKTT